MKNFLKKLIGYVAAYVASAKTQAEATQQGGNRIGTTTMLMNELIRIDERLVIIEKHQANIFRLLYERKDQA